MLRFAITDRRLLPDTPPGALPARCAQLAREGVDFILIREKDLPIAQLVDLSRHILAAVRETHAPTQVLIAQRVDVALAVGAHGVHLSAAPGELRPDQVRILMPHAFISVSCHRLDEVRRARRSGASAALVAPIFGKTVAGEEVAEGLGLDCLHLAAVAAREMPVFALGGITPANAPQCIAAGAVGIAAIRMFFAPLT